MHALAVDFPSLGNDFKFSRPLQWLYHFLHFAMAPRFRALFTVSSVLPRLDAKLKLSMGSDWLLSYYDY